MTDRELIARAIDEWFDDSGLDPEQMDSLADAVLAAIGDRLLPEIPTVLHDYRIVERYVLMPNNDDTWSFWALDDHDDMIVDGTSTTPVAAIRNALEGT